MLVGYCLNDFVMVPFALIITGTTFAYYYYYYYHHHHHHRISYFSALAGKYSPILGCSNQQDNYLYFKKFLAFEHVLRIADFCSCIYVYSGAS